MPFRLSCRFLIAALALVVGSESAFAADAVLPNMPPPSVNDLIIQVRQANADVSTIEEAKKIAQQDAPSGASANEQITFLQRRADAHRTTGDTKRQLADLKQIAELSRGSHGEPQHFFYYGTTELISGDVILGRNALLHVLSLVERNNSNWGVEINAHSSITYLNVRLGMMDAAENSLAKAKWMLGRLKLAPIQSPWLPVLEYNVGFAEGRLLIARGKWQEAEAILRHAAEQSEIAVRIVEKLVTQTSSAAASRANFYVGRNFVVGELVDHLLRMGKLDEAELLVRDMLSTDINRVGRHSVLTAMTLVKVADVMTARGRYRDALQVVAEAEDIERTIGVDRTNAFSLFLREAKLNALIGLENWQASVDVEQAAHRRAQEGLTGFDAMSPGVAIALIKTGRAAEAIARLGQYIPKCIETMGAAHYQVAEARGTKAMALVATGDHKGALAEFAVASEALIERASQEDEAQSRGITAMVRRQILEAYLDALADSRDLSDAAAQAFRIADALHLGKTQHALAQSAARAATKQADLGDLIRLDQDSKAEETTLYATLLRLSNLPADKQLPKVMGEMRKRIGVIKQERRERQTAIEKRYPAYANLVNPKPSELTEARAVLRPTEALVSIFSTEKASYMWAFKATGEVGFARAPLTRSAISQIVASVRKAVDPGDVDIANGLPMFDVDLTYRLYASLLQPVANGWKGADSLLVVANGALSQLPPALLPTAKMALSKDNGVRYTAYRVVPWLIREAAITQLPSVNSLLALRKLPQGTVRPREFVGFGDPEFSTAAQANNTTRRLRNLAVARFTEAPIAGPATTTAAVVPAMAVESSHRPTAWMPYDSIPPLPDTRDEILALAKVLNADLQKDVFLGKQASKDNVKKLDLSQTRIVAFATHGLLPGEFPGVDQPALALANPGNGQHGLLTLEEILGLKLHADWVVLSACNTAAGDGSGAEAVSGLGRGFFYAGTRSLLATHWPVESVSARLLVTGIFARQAATPTLARAQALRQSMLALMDERSAEGDFAYAHPIFWAPYALIGDGGE